MKTNIPAIPEEILNAKVLSKKDISNLAKWKEAFEKLGCYVELPCNQINEVLENPKGVPFMRVFVSVIGKDNYEMINNLISHDPIDPIVDISIFLDGMACLYMMDVLPRFIDIINDMDCPIGPITEFEQCFLLNSWVEAYELIKKFIQFRDEKLIPSFSEEMIPHIKGDE